MAELTPMMQQYFKIKEEHPDCLLFFRLGDFYEMFHDDARLGSEELGLTLTTRDRNKPEEERTPMCGVPYHSADSYIARLIARGYKVAICEQMEDPATAKGLVDRDIIRIVTPGTAMDDSMLEEGQNNYICAIYMDSAAVAAAFCDLSTGAFSVTAYDSREGGEHLRNELGRFSPREAVLSDGAWQDEELRDWLKRSMNCRCEHGGEGRFRPDAARALAEGQFAAGLENIPQGKNAPIQAAGGLLSYLLETQKTDLSHINTLTWFSGDRYMELDLTARRTLELTETFRGKEKRGSLLWVLDQTKTAMGARLLRSWIAQPLLSPAAIHRRLGAVEALVGDPIGRDELKSDLREVTDLERLIGRVAYGTAGGRDLVSLGAGLGKLPALRGRLEGLDSKLLQALQGEMDDLPDLRDLIARAIVDEPPFSVREGGVIRQGFDADVDRLRDVIDHGADMVAAVEAREKERTGIKSLKVRYNKVFGYFIEVSKSYYDQVPDDYIRKQTLVNCERFITQELKDLEHEILSAQDKITALEYQLFCRVRDRVNARVSDIQRSAAAVAQLDVLCSFASVAAERGYCRPVVDESDVIDIAEGRHPVVEKVLRGALFVPNDTSMNGTDGRLAIITGPNMAGKSTYMRQVALIVLMAQMGSFVPARSAHIGVVDRVFTRIGASDDLSAGQSTFMVEMTEVAEMLKNATSRSLLVLDEIGRGTSTYDGMSIARAVLEYCADKKRLGAKTLFATHYHELTGVEQEIQGVKNYHIAAKKRKDDIIFLRKIVPGGADQSYGIEVAKLAGVPSRVIDRARDILEQLEAQGKPSPAGNIMPADDSQLSMGDLAGAEVLDTLRSTAVETLTPIEAMNLLYQLKQKL
jgi:DNA mismatch repair protein MutS